MFRAFMKYYSPTRDCFVFKKLAKALFRPWFLLWKCNEFLQGLRGKEETQLQTEESCEEVPHISFLWLHHVSSITSALKVFVGSTHH